MNELINQLNDSDMDQRLKALKELMKKVDSGEIPRPAQGNDVNNHIHTIYSFSPYSPSKAVWMAFNSGLTTAGIMDHDSISGAREFIQAGLIVGMKTTIGIECRADMSKTPLNGLRLNNPDQDSIAYVTIHGIPHTQIDRVNEFFRPYLLERNKRNQLMTDKLTSILKYYDITLDFDTDIVPLSMSHEAGSITERHVLFAVSKKLVQHLGKGPNLVNFLKDSLKLDISVKLETLLSDNENPYYEYDLLGVLKSEMMPLFYIKATNECPEISKVVDLANEIGGILAYAYLGDVADSVTGDKKAQKFEDYYLDMLFEILNDLGIKSVTYMPSRNTIEQLERLKNLCNQYGYFQISGEDINSPRQNFVCEKQRLEMFSNLVNATWALIGHERAATQNLQDSFFSTKTALLYPDLENRIIAYMELGKV